MNPSSTNNLAMTRLTESLATSSKPVSFADLTLKLRRIAAENPETPMTPSALVTKALREGVLAGKVTLNPNGHWKSGDDLARLSLEEAKAGIQTLGIRWELTEKDSVLIAKALATGKPLTKFVPLGSTYITSRCTYCESIPSFETNGLEIRAIEPCKFPAGAFPVSFELNIPSGKIVFANDLKRRFDLRGRFSILTELGHRKTILQYANEGLAHCPMPNEAIEPTPLAIEQIDDGIFCIQYSPHQTEKATGRKSDSILIGTDRKEAKRLAELPISNGDWNGADYDLLKNSFGRKIGQFHRFLKRCTVISVPPGLYSVFHAMPDSCFTTEDSVGKDTTTPYSVIFRVGPAKVEPQGGVVKSKLAVSAEQVVWDAIRCSPGLHLPTEPRPKISLDAELLDFGRHLNRLNAVADLANVDDATFDKTWGKLTEAQRLNSLARAVNHILIEGGYGYVWHKDGSCCARPDFSPHSRAVPIPIFPPGLKWAHLSPGFGALSKAVGIGYSLNQKENSASEMGFSFKEIRPTPINESFRALAFNALQSIIRTGVPKPVRGRDFNEYLKTRRIESPKVARLILNRLARLYPNSVPDYCKRFVES